MKDQTNSLDRDEVLLAFQASCARPTTEDIVVWVRRYPQFAEDIRDHAAITLDIEAREDKFGPAISEHDLSVSFSFALNGLATGDKTRRERAANDMATFQEIITARGKTIASLANEIGGIIGIGRDIVAAMVNGGMKPPISRRFKEAVTRALTISSETFDQKLTLALARPRAGMAKASVAPRLNQRSFDEIVRTSDMAPNQIQYWLSED